jgi:hypothetical protein
MMRMKDVNPNAVKLRLFSCSPKRFPVSLRGKAKDWLLTLPRESITSWDKCCDIFMTKFLPLAKTIIQGLDKKTASR